MDELIFAFLSVKPPVLNCFVFIGLYYTGDLFLLELMSNPVFQWVGKFGRWGKMIVYISERAMREKTYNI